MLCRKTPAFRHRDTRHTFLLTPLYVRHIFNVLIRRIKKPRGGRGSYAFSGPAFWKSKICGSDREAVGYNLCLPKERNHGVEQARAGPSGAKHRIRCLPENPPALAMGSVKRNWFRTVWKNRTGGDQFWRNFPAFDRFELIRNSKPDCESFFAMGRNTNFRLYAIWFCWASRLGGNHLTGGFYFLRLENTNLSIPKIGK